MKEATILKAMAFVVAMALGMLLPMSASAQRDDLLRVDDSFNGPSSVVTWTIVNNGIGQTAPLSDGLLVLGAAGAGYALTRHRSQKSRKTSKSHNKGVVMFATIALMLCFTQCRKNVDTITGAVTEGVFITLNVDNGSKVVVNPTGHSDPAYATVTWETNDTIYVGNNGKYCGYLLYNSSTEKFSGTIDPKNEDDYLHFYFMGNKVSMKDSETAAKPTANTTTTFYVNITDQTEKYPVISYGHSTYCYNSTQTNYEATLYNKCAIVKFKLSTDAILMAHEVTIDGMKNTVIVDFSANNGATTGEPYTFSKVGDGDITLHAESKDVRWAILLPQAAVTNAKANATGYTSTDVSVPAIDTNGYYTNDGAGYDVVLTTDLPTGALPGLFTVNSSGDQVRFASGNLTYTSDTWAFVSNNSWEYNTSASAKGKENGSQHFYWGTVFQSASSGESALLDEITTALGSGWRSFSFNEMNYLLGHYNNVKRTVRWHHFAKITSTEDIGVNNKRYLLIFPDDFAESDWNETTMGTKPTTFDNKTSDNAIAYSATNFAAMQSAGIVVLPAPGSYENTAWRDFGNMGWYWTSTSASSSNARRLFFDSGNVNTEDKGKNGGYRSVRLVRDI